MSSGRKPKLKVRVERSFTRVPWILYAASTLWMAYEPSFTAVSLSIILLFVAAALGVKPHRFIVFIASLATGFTAVFAVSYSALASSLQLFYLAIYYTGVLGERARVVVLLSLIAVFLAGLFPFQPYPSFEPGWGVVSIDWSPSDRLLAVGVSGTFGRGPSGGAALMPLPVSVEISGFYVVNGDLEPVYSMPHYAYTTMDVAWSSDGRYLAVATGEATVIVVSNGTWGWRLIESSPARVTSVDWCGDLLVYGDDLGYVYAYMVGEGLIAHRQVSLSVKTLECSPTGNLVVVGTGTGEILFLDPHSLEGQARLELGSPVNDVAWAADGSKVAAGLSSGEIVVLGLDGSPRILYRLGLSTPDLWSGAPQSLVWTSGGYLVAGSGGSLQVYRGHRLVWSSGDAGGMVSALAYDGGSDRLFLGTYLYNLQRTSGKVVSVPFDYLLTVPAVSAMVIMVFSAVMFAWYLYGMWKGLWRGG